MNAQLLTWVESFLCYKKQELSLMENPKFVDVISGVP